MRPAPERCRAGYYPVQVEIATRYGDLDPQGHVNNVAVASYYEEARLQFHGGLAGADRPAGSRTLVAHHAMDFLAEIAYPASVAAGVRVTRIGRSAYTLETGLFQGGTCVGVASTVIVYAEPAGPAPLPLALRAHLERHQGGRAPE